MPIKSTNNIKTRNIFVLIFQDSFLDQFPEGDAKKDDFWRMALVGLGIGVAAAATFAIASRQ